MTGPKELEEAIRADDAERVAALLQASPQMGEAPVAGMRPLTFSVYVRAPHARHAILAAGVLPTVFEAAMTGDEVALHRHLLRDGALAHAHAPDGFTPLHLAAHFGQLGVARALVKAGAALDAMGGPPLANTPLHAAAAGGQATVVEFLLDRGAKPDVVDGNGYRPLHVAAAAGSIACCQALLFHGADLRATGPDGKDAREIARARGHDRLAEHLARYPAP